MLDLSRLLRPLSNRIANLAGRGFVRRVELGGLRLQIEVMGVTIPDAEHHQPYGFYSVPIEGATCVAVFPNGDQAHPLVPVVSDRRHRPKDGKPGEAGLHNHVGLRLAMLPDGTIEARSASGTAGQLATLADLKALADAIKNWKPVANDGGAALKTALEGLFASWPTGTHVLKAE